MINVAYKWYNLFEKRNEIFMEIRKIIIYKLDKMGISRYRLAKILKISTANIYRFLDGERRSVGAEKMVSIANLIGLSSPLALFEIEPVKDLIHHLDITQKNRAFQKACLYLNLKYYFENSSSSVQEQLDSLRITMVEVIPEFDLLPITTILQFLSDYFLRTNNTDNTIVTTLLEKKINGISCGENDSEFDAYTPYCHNLEVERYQIHPNDMKRKAHQEGKIYSEKDLQVMLKDTKTRHMISTYRRRLDIYYRYINEEIPLKIAEEILALIDRTESLLYKPLINDIDYIFYQMFNYEIINYPPRYDEFNDRYNRLIKINMYDKIRYDGIVESLKYSFTQYQIPYRETSNVIIGVRVNDEGVNKIIPKNNYAVVELDAKYEDGDYVLVSLQKQDAVIVMVHELQSKGKSFIKYASYDETFVNRTYEQEEIKVFGKVIDAITIIKK